MFSTAFGFVLDQFDCCPWGGIVGHNGSKRRHSNQLVIKPSLYSPDERRRRDASPWTLVQGVLAPAQFAIFLVSAALVIHFLITGEGATFAITSVVVKTVALYAIMITGSIWERAVFGRYLFAPAFFWEDVVSMLVLALHTGYLAAYMSGALDTHHLMLLALAAYASYVINAAQFVLKLRTARLQQTTWPAPSRTLGVSA